MKSLLLPAALRLFLWRIALLWAKSLRIVHLRSDALDDILDSGGNYVGAFWHGSMFVGWFVHRPLPGMRVSALVSQSKDGEYLSTVLERWGMTMVRGSSHIGGKEAMQLMIDALTSGSSLAITPDGPRGPRQEMKMGAVRAAQVAGVPLILTGIAMESKKVLRSWDAFEVPMPFSRVVVVYSEAIIVPKDLTGEPLDVYKREMQRRLQVLTKEAEHVLHSRSAA